MRQTNFKLPEQPQSDSVLFARFPGEVRNLIYSYTFAEYALPEDTYSADTCYARPGYLAHGRTHISFLKTCQKVYNEAWFLPWTGRDHTFYFTEESRRPEVTTTREVMEETLTAIHEAHGEEATAMQHVRVFAQLFNLEPGTILQSILDLPHFNPKVFTITLRHTDWWGWEIDSPLRIGSQFVNECRFPDSVREVRVELESVQRRRHQIEEIATLMHMRWWFRRRDGSCFVPTDDADEVMRWEGSSTWNDERWLKDETKPERLEYHVQTVRFLVQEADSPSFSPDDPRHPPPNLSVTRFHPLRTSRPCVQIDELKKRGIGPGHSADAVAQFLSRWEDICYCGMLGDSCCKVGEELGAGYVDSGQSTFYCNNCLNATESKCPRSHLLSRP